MPRPFGTPLQLLSQASQSVIQSLLTCQKSLPVSFSLFVVSSIWCFNIGVYCIFFFCFVFGLLNFFILFCCFCRAYYWSGWSVGRPSGVVCCHWTCVCESMYASLSVTLGPLHLSCYSFDYLLLFFWVRACRFVYSSAQFKFKQLILWLLYCYYWVHFDHSLLCFSFDYAYSCCWCLICEIICLHIRF